MASNISYKKQERTRMGERMKKLRKDKLAKELLALSQGLEEVDAENWNPKNPITEHVVGEGSLVVDPSIQKKLKKGGRRKTRKKKGGSIPCTMGSDLCCLKEGYLTEDGHLGPLGKKETPQNIIEQGYEHLMNEYEDCSDKKDKKDKIKSKPTVKDKKGKPRETCSGFSSQGDGESCVVMGGRRKTRRKKRKKKKRKTKKRRKRKKRKTKKRYRNQRGCKR